MRIVPISLEESNAFVSQHHRHHKPTPGHKFSVAVADENGVVRGVAIVGRPVSRMADNGWTLEVNRCCTDGAPNACSMLYRAAWRAAKALGYGRLITYTLPEEGGASLKGAGFRLVGERGGGKWSRANRPRVDLHPTQTKWLWEVAEPKACEWTHRDVGVCCKIASNSVARIPGNTPVYVCDYHVSEFTKNNEYEITPLNTGHRKATQAACSSAGNPGGISTT